MIDHFEEYVRQGKMSPEMLADKDGGVLAPESLTDALVAAIIEKHPNVKMNRVDSLGTVQELYSMPAATQTLLDDGVADIESWFVREVVDIFVVQMIALEQQVPCETCGHKRPTFTYAGEVNYTGEIRILRDPYSAKPYILFYSTFNVDVLP